MILTGSASRRASPGAASPTRAHCSPASPRRKCRRPRRAPASRPGRPPTPAFAVAAAAARAEGEARGAGPRALPDPAAPSCLERAAKPGRERCEVRASERAGGQASGRARVALGARLRTRAWTPGPSRLRGRGAQPARSARAASQRPAGNATPAPIWAEPLRAANSTESRGECSAGRGWPFEPRCCASPSEPGRTSGAAAGRRLWTEGRLGSASARGAGEHLNGGLWACEPWTPRASRSRSVRSAPVPRRGEQSTASRAAVRPRGPRPRPGCSPSHTPPLGPAGRRRAAHVGCWAPELRPAPPVAHWLPEPRSVS